MQSRMLEAAGVSPGWLAIAAVGVAVVSYFLGCFNGAVVVSRYILRDDIREHGSGNAGLTNFYRTFGGPLTAVVILSDVLKAVVAVLFATFIAGRISPALVVLSEYWAGAFCIIGHMFPCTFQFRGGKGVLSGGALTVMIGIGGGGVLPSWLIPLVALVGFIVLAASTRYVSLGSCWGGASFIVMSWLVYRDPLILLLAVVMGGLLLWRHRGNMVRIVTGTESKFTLHKKPGTDEAPNEAEEKAEQKPEKTAAEKPGKKSAKKSAKKAAKAREKPAAKKAEEEAVRAESAPETAEDPSAGKEEEDLT